ncbi:MAG: S41 family peptidase, partial [Sciscionella sp.]
AEGGSPQQPAEPEPPRTRVDVDGLDQRLVAMPVPAGRYSSLQAVAGGIVWLHEPLQGETGDDRARVTDEAARPSLEHLSLATGVVTTLAEPVDAVYASGDGKRLVVRDKGALRVVPADHKAESAAGQPASPDVAEVDLDRVRVHVEPVVEWRQMYDEAWRLMRDHFWRADMGGVDWSRAHDRYAALIGRIGSRDDLVDLIWEMHGELGSSHAYCAAPAAPPDPARQQGLLGADLELVDGRWVLRRIVLGEASDPRARSPLTAPGVAVREGDVVVAVDGHPVSETISPAALLVGAAGKPVELTVAPRGGVATRHVAVVPLANELPLRYQDWVRDRRQYVHARTEGRVGYVHVPDMSFVGWAQLHRDLATEVGRDGLVVDIRGNGGGFISQLVVEKLMRTIIGWDCPRGYRPASYPQNARRGPMVAVTDMYAGSDGDIVTAAIRSYGLGPVIGTRTWGGVIGIDGRYRLVDGTTVTQPRYPFWFEKFGWGVENHGVDPDIEVVTRPQ